MGKKEEKIQKFQKIGFFGKNIWPRRDFENFADIFQKKTLHRNILKSIIWDNSFL